MERTYDEEIHKRIDLQLRKTTGFFTNSWRIKIALESYFEGHAQEVRERNWMNLEMQTTLLDTYPPKLIATILKALREQLIESDNLHSVEEIADRVPEMSLEYDQILEENSGMMSIVGICPKIMCWLRVAKRLIWCILKVSTRLFQCKSAEMRHETVGPNLGGLRQVCGSDTQENSIEVVCKRVQNEETR